MSYHKLYLPELYTYYAEQTSPRPITGKSTGPSPHTRIAGSSTIQDHLPVPTSPDFPAPRPASSPTPGHTYPSSIRPSSSSAQRPYTAPAETLRPLLGRGGAERGGSINLPPLASITENIPRELPAFITLDPIRDFTARPTSSSASANASRPSGTASDWTASSFRPSWSTESSRPTTDYSFGRTSTSTAYTSSFSSGGRVSDVPQISGWPPRPPTSGQQWGNAPLPVMSPHFDPLPLRPSTSAQPRVAAAMSDAFPSRPQSSGLAKLHSAHRAPVSSSLSSAQPDTTGEPVVGADDTRYNANFSRVLVGSVCAMCQRLTDEDGEEGLFFFTHDLAVRTEGTFRLKFSLSNLEP